MGLLIGDERNAMTTDFPATKTAHWPTGPVFCCDRHAQALERIGSALGMQLAITHAVPDDAECVNCRNEAVKYLEALREKKP